MKISGIYQIQSKVKPERIYIGSAVNIKSRWSVHLCQLRLNKHGSQKIQKHFNKYGESDLQFSVLLGCEKIDLLKHEQYFIDFYNPYFNSCKIAGSSLGTKRGTSWNKGKKLPPLSEEHKQNISKGGLGKKHKSFSEETKHRQSVARLGKEPWNKGKTGVWSKETLLKMSKSHLGNKCATGHTFTPTKERNDKISKSLIGNKRRVGKIPWNKGIKKTA